MTQEWQPIKTAPKDGTWIVGFAQGTDNFAVGLTYWRNAGGWEGFDRMPTHWIALPKYPQ